MYGRQWRSWQLLALKVTIAGDSISIKIQAEILAKNQNVATNPQPDTMSHHLLARILATIGSRIASSIANSSEIDTKR